MKRASASLLKTLVVLIAVGIFVFLLGAPHFEGRNVHSTLFEIYFNDPFLAYAYIASIPFFVSLYQAFKLLGDAGRNELNQESVKSLKAIQYCAMAMIVLIAIGVVWLLFVESDDRPPIILMGLVATLISIGVVTGAARFAKKLQRDTHQVLR